MQTPSSSSRLGKGLFSGRLEHGASGLVFMLVMLVGLSAMGVAAVSISSTELLVHSPEYRSSLMPPRVEPGASLTIVPIPDQTPADAEAATAQAGADDEPALERGVAAPDTVFTGFGEVGAESES